MSTITFTLSPGYTVTASRSRDVIAMSVIVRDPTGNLVEVEHCEASLHEARSQFEQLVASMTAGTGDRADFAFYSTSSRPDARLTLSEAWAELVR